MNEKNFSYASRGNDRLLGDTLFALDGQVYPSSDVTRARKALTELARLHKERSPQQKTAKEVASLFRHLVFGWYGLRSKTDWCGDDFTLTSTLNNRRASCLGISLIYLALADWLRLPLFGLLYDEHISICYVSSDAKLHIEPLYQGKPCPPSLVAKLFPPPYPPGYGVPLPKDHLVAVVLSNRAAFVRAQRGDYESALHELNQAISLFPTYVTPWINKSVILARLGRMTEAYVALRGALSLDPGPRLRQKICILQTSLSSGNEEFLG